MRLLANHLVELNSFRHLLKSWATREIKIRYKQSLLGGLWAVLQPLSMALIFSIVFSYFIKVSTGGIPHIIFYYSVLFPWTFFSNSISVGANSLVNNQNLVSKIYFPREILPIGTIIAALFDFMIAFVIYMGLALIYRVSFSFSLILIPVLIISQLLFTIPLVLILSALNVFFRDIRFVIPLMIQIYLYAVPMIYPISSVPERFRQIYMLNPMAGILDSYRVVLAYGQWPELFNIIYPLVFSLLLFFVCYALFVRVSKSFADLI